MLVCQLELLVSAAVLVQLSDPHIRIGPDDRGSARALAAAVERVLALPDRPAAVLVSGDIADSGAAAEYERARELLAPLDMPVHLLAGNHDAFPERTAYTAACGGIRLVACDTSIPGRDEGELDADWLAARLAEDAETPTVVALHHHPVALGIPWLDRIGLRAPERLAAVLTPNVRRVVAGHVHRTSFATLAGVPVVTCASTNLQARLELGATTMEMVAEPPSLLVHALAGGELVTHVQPV